MCINAGLQPFMYCLINFSTRGVHQCLNNLAFSMSVWKFWVWWMDTNMNPTTHLPQCIFKNSYKIKFKVVKLTIDIRSLGSLMHTSCSKQLSCSFLGPFGHFFMLPPILVNSTNDRSPEFWPLTSNDLRLTSNFAWRDQSGSYSSLPNFSKIGNKKIANK